MTTPVPPMPEMTSSITDVAGHPVVVVVAVVAAALVVLATAFPKIAGPLRDGIERWTMSVRRAQGDAKASVIADLEAECDRYQEMVRDLRTELADERRATAQHTEVLTRHCGYDQAMIALVTSLGGTPPAYLPLWPICPKTGSIVHGPPHDGPDPTHDRK